MKISFITKHSVSNYGSILQTYATQEIIKKLGCESEIINYIRYDLRSKNLCDTLLKNQPRWNKNCVTKVIYKTIQKPSYMLMEYKFKKYRKKLYDNVTKLYGSNEELKKSSHTSDVYCTGSDQIWGKNGNGEIDKAYFLDFVPKNSKCISYAASIGLEEVSEEFQKQIKPLLEKYQNITVREQSAVDILEKNSIKATLVLDPTLLLKKGEWEKIIEGKKKRNYILIYQLHANKNFEKYAKEFSKKMGLPLIRVTASINQITKCGQTIYLPTPGKFLNYIKNASYILTDSFHGTVFSIIFNKEFISINPGDTATRIKNILKLVNIEDRLLTNYEDFSLINKKINWKDVNKILDREREKSINIFKDSIFQNHAIKNVDDMNKNICTGCRACEQLCPKNAITMVSNKEGFIEPKIDKDKCINCGVCILKCPQLNKKEIKNEPKVYAMKLKNKKEQLESSSGGAFVAIAKEVLKRNGIVYGCAFSKDLIAKHIKIDSEKDLWKLKGSKYVQSDTQHTYTEVKKFLENNKEVLYSGTPCQIGGLKAYLGKEYKNLITVDLICHGVPSPKLFEKYKKWLEKKYKSKIVWYEFRNKEKYLWGLNSKIVFQKNNKLLNKYQGYQLDPYYKSFCEAYTYRECCYKCIYANYERIADFTIGDYWGIEKQQPEFNDINGVSFIILNTEKSKQIFDKYIKENIDYKESSLEMVSKKNKNLYMPATRPSQRTYIYEDIDSLDFKKYAKNSLKFKKKIRYIISMKIPQNLKRTIKKVVKK